MMLYFKDSLIDIRTKKVEINLDVTLGFIEAVSTQINKQFGMYPHFFQQGYLSQIQIQTYFSQYYGNFKRILNESIFEKIEKFISSIVEKRQLLLICDSTIQLRTPLILIKSQIGDTDKLIKLSNIKFNTSYVTNPVNRFFLIEQISILGVINLKNIGLTTKNYRAGSQNSVLSLFIEGIDFQENSLISFLNEVKKLDDINALLKQFEKIQLISNSLNFNIQAIGNFYEIIQEKKKLNDLLQIAIIRSFPQVKISDSIEFEVVTCCFGISESDKLFAKRINDNEDKKMQMINDFCMDSLIEKQEQKKFEKIKLLNLKISKLVGCFSFDEDRISTKCDKIEVSVVEHQYSLLKVDIVNCEAFFTNKTIDANIDFVAVQVSSVPKIFDIICVYLNEFIAEKLIRFVAKVNQFAFDKNNSKDSETQLNESAKTNVNLNVKKLEVSVSNLLEKVRMHVDIIELKNENVQIKQVDVYNMFESESVKASFLCFKGIVLKNKKINLNEIKLDFTNSTIAMVLNIVDSLSENPKKLIKSLSQINEKITKIVAPKKPEPEHTEQTISQKKESGNFLIIDDLTEKFNDFNLLFKIDQNSLVNADYFENKTKEWIDKYSIKSILKCSLFVSLISVIYRDLEENSSNVLKLNNLYVYISSELILSFLENIRVDFQKENYLGKVLENGEKDFYMKFFLEFLKNNEINFYARPSNINMYSDTKISEMIDLKTGAEKV